MVKADGYGHGLLRLGARRAGRRRDLARHGDHRRGARAARGRHRRARPRLAVDARRDRHGARRDRRRHRPVGQQRVAARDRRRGRPRARAAPPASTSRSTPDCRATGLRRRLAGPGRARRPRSDAVRRRRHLEPLRLRRRARPSRRSASSSTRSATRSRSPSRVGVQPEVRHLANSAATLTLPDAHFDLVRPGIAVYGLTPVPQQGDFGLVPAMTLRVAAGLGQAGACRRGRVVRPRLHDHPRHHARARPARLRRRHPAARHQRRAGVDQRPAASRSAAGCAWTSSSSTSAISTCSER